MQPNSGLRRLPRLLVLVALLSLAPSSVGHAVPVPDSDMSAPRARSQDAAEHQGLDAGGHQGVGGVADGSGGLVELDSPVDILRAEAGRPPEAKLQPALREVAARGGEEDRTAYVVVRSAEAVDLSAFDPHAHAFTWPAGEHLAILRVAPRDLPRLAALPGVASVESGDPLASATGAGWSVDGAAPGSAGIAVDGVDPVASVDLRQRLDAAPHWGAGAATDVAGLSSKDRGSPAPDAWFDVRSGHGTSDAWAQGFRGEGVTMAVLDTGVDFGHPDMHGTWKVLPEGHPYAGWPQAYDPGGVYHYMLDTQPESTTLLTRQARSGVIQTYQSSDVIEREIDGVKRKTACFRPLLSTRQLGQEDCATLVPESKSGRPRYGHHPDGTLNGPASDANSQFMGVLLTDAETAGVYDTVYVDLDRDHDFTDEKPATRESPLAWRDVTADGIADLSGGLLYFIADGELPLPGAYLWGIAERVPEAGSAVAIFYDTANHGTLCASNMVSQGRLGVPPDINLRFDDLPDGRPAAINPGAAPDARLVGVIVFTGPSQLVIDSAWRYVTLGHDPDREDDAIQLSSNSYVFSGVEDGGWDSTWSRPIDYYNQTYSPHTIWTGGTGNGGPGYGTTMPPLPLASVKVAGTTQSGSTGTDSIARTDQITFGDIVPFSNRGPTSDGRLGPDVAADGASAAGSLPINLVFGGATGLRPEQRNGAYATVTWGGTSRSGPVQAGNLALIYQAWKAKHGRWPLWQEAQALVMAGARYQGYDPFSTGAGALDAGDSTRVASGAHGVYALPPKWNPGDYRGTAYPAFTKLVKAGQTARGAIKLVNPGGEPLELRLSTGTPRRLGSIKGEIEGEIATDGSRLSPLSTLAPDYLAALDREDIPEGTELMIVRAIHPLSEVETLDPATGSGDYRLERQFSLAVYQHTDLDGDGKLWEDMDANGVVGHPLLAGATQGIDRTPAIDFAAAEIDPHEYMRFANTNQMMSNLQLWVHHPLERWKDGLYIGLTNTQYCTGANNCTGRAADAPNPTVRYRVDFYGWERWSWLAAAQERVTVPAGGELSVDATLAVPAAAAPGAYQGAIFADYVRGEGDRPVPTGGGWELPGRRLVIPVHANVAVDYGWEGAVTLGGAGARVPDDLYDNGAIYGGQSWLWRAESGDWRHFLFDMAEPAPGTHLVTRTTWRSEERGWSDIDTRLWGPAPDEFSGDDPDYFGPHSMRKIGESPFLHQGRGNYAFHTSSGEGEDWVVAPAGEGLHEVTLHNVRSDGRQFELPFETEVGGLVVEPAEIEITGNACRRVRVTSQLALPDHRLAAAGLSVPESLSDLPISQTASVDQSYKHGFRLEQAPRIFTITVTGQPGDDLDLYLLFDRDDDGQFNRATEQIAAAAGPGGTETLSLGPQPAGRYQAWVHGSTVAASTSTFDLDLRAIGGDDVHLDFVPGVIQAGRPYDFEVCVRDVDLDRSPPAAEGVVTLGPGGAPALLSLPVWWTARPPERPDLYLPALVKEALLGDG